jgi:hypothetical protein
MSQYVFHKLTICFAVCVLVSQDRTVKVADLGEARELYETCEPEDLPNPALNWAPPEVLFGLVWSCLVLSGPVYSSRCVVLCCLM